MRNIRIGVPLRRGIPVSQIAVQRDHGKHARGPAGLDIALIVAQIQTGAGLYTEAAGGFEQWIGMGLGTRTGVATDDAIGALPQAEGL
jgi:hypothetical protein